MVLGMCLCLTRLHGLRYMVFRKDSLCVLGENKDIKISIYVVTPSDKLILIYVLF